MSNLDETDGRPFFRRRRKGWSLLILAAALFIFGATAGTLYFFLRPVTLRIAVGPSGSDDEQLVQALAQLFAREGGPVRLSLIATGGSPESIALLGESKTDLAVARGDLDMPDDARSVAIIRKNTAVLWSTQGGLRGGKTGKIEEIGDLAGRRVGIVGGSPANIALLRIILQETGVNPQRVAMTQFDPSSVAAMARDPAIDAFMAVGPPDSRVTAEAISATARARGEPVFLPVDVSETIAQKHPLYESGEIPSNTFSSSPARPKEKIETVVVNHLIVAPGSLSETAVGTFVRQLFAARQTLAKELPSAAKIEKPDTDKDAALPAHEGAAAFIDGTERTFLEKYSDYIWASILLLSMLGSGGAFLRHYLTHDEKALNTLHRDRLLAKISEVRQAQSVNELADMQREVDAILRETLDCYDDGAIEAGDLAAFGLVMEQFHHAVVDRRTVIAAAAPNRARSR